MANINRLKKDIEAIKERNKRVEADKAWETSWTRKIVLLILTYIIIVIFFLITGLSKPFLNALVPAIAFVLSTLTLSLFKKMWIENLNK